MSQEHALVTIEQNAMVQQKAPAGLAVGTINYGVSLYEMFAAEDEGETKVQQLAAMAKVITTGEFTDAIKSAKSIADAADKANGFTKADGAKGQDAYGPKRRLVNSRMSEAKRIFGVFKQAPDVMQEKGYWLAVQTARQWLIDNGKTWDGNHAETKDDKELRKAQSLDDLAWAQIRKDLPQKMGETMQDYAVRTEAEFLSRRAAVADEAVEKRVETLVQSLLKQFGDERNILEQACIRILTLNSVTEETDKEPKETVSE